MRMRAMCGRAAGSSRAKTSSCCSARDSLQAEILVQRHLTSRDAFVHADLSGAPVCVVKHPGGAAYGGSGGGGDGGGSALVGSDVSELPPLTLSQAGTAVLCRSEGWSGKVVTSAWWVKADAVTKEDGHGGTLPQGVFRARGGGRAYLPPSQMVMGFGILFRVGLGCVAKHVDERRVRGGANDEDEAEAEEEVSEEVEVPAHAVHGTKGAATEI